MKPRNTNGPGNYEPIRPIEVKVDGSFDEACKKFKAAFQREKVVSRLKEIECYEKPSDKKRRKKREAQERKLQQESRDKLLKTGEWEKRQKRKNAKRQRKLEERLRRQAERGFGNE